MLLLALLFSVCLALSPSEQEALKRFQSMSPAEFRAEVCPDLEQSGGLLKCAPENPEELYAPAYKYIEEHGMPDAATLAPIVILPGMGGSALQAKISKHQAPHWWCWQNWDEWFRDWLPIVELLAQDCWFDNLRVNFNVTTSEYSNQDGVTIDTIDFGGMSGIDYMDYWLGIPIPFTTYYSTMIASFEKIGYVHGKNLFGAPYDWRLPSNSHALDEQSFNGRFLNLIENAYTTNGNVKVHILTHSMGGPTALSFLNIQPQAWLDKYVASFIPIAGPWAGSAKALKTTLTGDNFGIEIDGINLLNIEAISALAKQAGGIIELVPHSRYYKDTTVFVTTPERNYTAMDFSQLYIDAGSPITAVIQKTTEKMFEVFVPPRVATHCIYGYGFKTEISYDYTNGLTKQPQITYSNDGDGTVPIESLQECGTWKDLQPQPVDVKSFNLDHQNILEDENIFSYILSITVTNN